MAMKIKKQLNYGRKQGCLNYGKKIREVEQEQNAYNATLSKTPDWYTNLPVARV